MKGTSMRTFEDVGTAAPETVITVQPDLAAFVQDMAVHNGLDVDAYTNNLIDRGMRLDLIEFGYTESSVRKFILDLRQHKRCDWELLELTS
jgi:hypothetical protein